MAMHVFIFCKFNQNEWTKRGSTPLFYVPHVCLLQGVFIHTTTSGRFQSLI